MLNVWGTLLLSYRKVNDPEVEKAGIRICVDLKISNGSQGDANNYRYMSTELGIVTVKGTLMSQPIVSALV